MCKECDKLVRLFSKYIADERRRAERHHNHQCSNVRTIIDNLENGNTNVLY